MTVVIVFRLLQWGLATLCLGDRPLQGAKRKETKTYVTYDMFVAFRFG